MPLTEFQRQVLLLLKANRNPDSYVAGGIAIHRASSSARQSSDIDLFHDADEAVARSSAADIQVLREHGYSVAPLITQPSFVRAVVSRGSEAVKLEWVRDTAFRFFPVVEDQALGYRLHDLDLAVNKCLTLANRTEVRDIIDLIELHQSVLSLPAACWAACGKDPGFTPELVLDCMRRHSRIDPQQLAAESLTRPIHPVDLKRQWLALLDAASEQISTFPSEDLGCIYLTQAGEPIRVPTQALLRRARRHFGTVGGSWPRIV